MGVNPIAFLVTRACAEMNVMAVKLGARAHTMASLAGIGDLMFTCIGRSLMGDSFRACLSAAALVRDQHQPESHELMIQWRLIAWKLTSPIVQTSIKIWSLKVIAVADPMV